MEYKIKTNEYPGGCPKCGSSNMSGSSFEMEAGEAWQPVECNDCGFKWNEIYRFNRWEPKLPGG